MDSSPAINGDKSSSESAHSSSNPPDVDQEDQNDDCDEIVRSQSEFEKQIMAASCPTLKYCRLCMSKQQQLVPLFARDGKTNKTLLYRILNCLTITLSFEKDFDTFICRICIQEVTKFFFYKEQCLANDLMIRGRNQHSKKFFFGNGTNRSISLSEESFNDENEEPINFEPIDSDEFDIPDERHKNQLNRPVDSEINRVEPAKKNASETAPNPAEVVRKRNDIPEYIYQGYRFVNATVRGKNKVHWKCMHKSKQKCRAVILVSSNGTVTSGVHRHNHQKETERVNHKEGSILDTGSKQTVPYELIPGQQSKIQLATLIVGGYSYRYIKANTSQTSIWKCKRSRCMTMISVRMDFSSFTVKGNFHKHPAEGESNEAPGNDEKEEEEPMQEISYIDNGNGPKKNMIYKGYEFGFPRVKKRHTKWACAKKSMFNCSATVCTTSEGKVIRQREWPHNHEPNDEFDLETVIEGHMTEITTKKKIAYKLIPGTRVQRFILYNNYRYSSDRLMSDGRITWKCTKCKVFIVIAGRFTSFEDRGGEHEHPPLEEDDDRPQKKKPVGRRTLNSKKKRPKQDSSDESDYEPELPKSKRRSTKSNSRDQSYQDDEMTQDMADYYTKLVS